LAKRTGARILHASTSEVYGDPDVHPQVESYRGNVNPIGPRACYDEGKRAAETLCFDFRRMYGTRVKVVRIFNTYGPYMHPYDGRVVSNFICQAMRGEPLTIYGDGSQTRSFCYVSDMIRGFRLMMDTPDAETGPVNLGNPDEYSVLQLAAMIAEASGTQVKVDPRRLPQDDPTRRRPDITLARKLLGWEPTVALRDGIAQTVKWFRSIELSDYSPPSPNVLQPEAQQDNA
jgi:UDP-glucuronate decarboxylase